MYKIKKYFLKNIYPKKACETRDLSHEIGINRYKKI
jgi:hypothetical protein